MKCRIGVCILAIFLSVLTLTAEERQTYEKLITAAALPDGYKMIRKDVKNNAKVLATKLTLYKEGVVSKVIVTVERHKLPTDGHRLAALKGYVNGNAKALAASGLRIVSKDIPDLSNLDYSKRTIVSMMFEDAEKKSYYVEIQTFFSDVGHNILVIATSKKELKMLSAWSASVKPK